MRSSLWVRLVGAFLVVIAAGAVATYVVVNGVTATQFRRYVLAEDVSQAQALAGPLASYHAREGTWQGVEDLLVSSRPMPEIPGPGMRHGPMMAGLSMQEMMEAMQSQLRPPDRVVLLDSRGQVVVDTTGVMVGEMHPDDHLVQGVPVSIGAERVGTVLVGSMIEPTLNPLAADFLRSVNASVLAIALLGALLALGMGLLLFRQITAPLGKATAAAEAVAGGDLNQRVDEQGAEELRRLARAFNHMAISLTHAEQLRRNLIADVAHELRTPIFVMQGNLEAMLDGVFPLNRENVAAVHQETLLLGRLVGDLRELASAEAGEMRLERVPCDLNHLVRLVVDRHQIEAQEKSLSLEVDLDPAIPSVLADPQRVEQVLVNLLANASHHTPPGGQITVSTQAQPHQVSVTVVDNGLGIAAEDLPFVFERFYRADKSRSRASGGGGLGLTIARQIITAHGGEISAFSAGLDQGSAFTFTLPIVTES